MSSFQDLGAVSLNYKTEGEHALPALNYFGLLPRGFCRVSIRKTFAQFLRNETQHFSFFAHQFCAKKQQFAQSFAKVISRKIALFRFCETQVLRNSATRVLRNSAIFLKIKRFVTTCVFLRIKFWKILFWNVFLLVTFT